MELKQVNFTLQYLDDLREHKILKDPTFYSEEKLFSYIDSISECLTPKEYNGLINELLDCIHIIKHQYMQFGATGNEIAGNYNEEWTPDELLKKNENSEVKSKGLTYFLNKIFGEKKAP